MTTQDKLSAAANQARKAIDSAKDTIASTDFDALRSKASDTASALYKGGRDALPDSDDLSRVSDQFAASIRRNPLAAVGVAFAAGLVLALLTRG